ncbi:amidase signature domain-containing protein, partial [Penicillium alfredii]
LLTKAHVGIAGRENTSGFAGWVGRESPGDANAVNILLEAGAMIYARTNEPQGLMSIETCNNITGNTVNPYNTDLSASGSSGESALQALHGSPLGIASDIGGSIRVPAANYGLYGLKPTTGRLPLIGLAAHMLGCETIMPTIGHLSPTLGRVGSLNANRARESYIHKNGKKLTVGAIWNDGEVTPAPPVTRALREVVERLKIAPDVDVIEWKPYQQYFEKDSMLTVRCQTRLYNPDEGEAFARNLEFSGEPYASLTAWAARDAPGIEKLSHQGEWNTVALEMDVILCPVYPTPAPQLHTSRYRGYASIWNLLDYPALVFPVTKIQPERDAKDPVYTPQNEFDRWCYDHYDAVAQQDAPVALQLVATKLEDENLVQGFKEIKEKIGLPFVDCLG